MEEEIRAKLKIKNEKNGIWKRGERKRGSLRENQGKGLLSIEKQRRGEQKKGIGKMRRGRERGPECKAI